MAQHNHKAEDLAKMIEQLKAENEALRAKVKVKGSVTSTGLSLKVSEKGAVSIYGLGRFPVTLYGTQILKLAETMPEILAFVAENKDKLASKPEKAKAQTEAA